jgi:hypothetical protein
VNRVSSARSPDRMSGLSIGIVREIAGQPPPKSSGGRVTSEMDIESENLPLPNLYTGLVRMSKLLTGAGVVILSWHCLPKISMYLFSMSDV